MNYAHLENLSVGLVSTYERRIVETDADFFAQISGDYNPIHFDDEYASKSIFKGRIAHGLCVASLISASLGTIMPGAGCIYLNQTLTFKAPVRFGDLVTVRIVVSNIEKNGVVTLDTHCFVDKTLVLTGEAKLLIPK